ncbi:MAG: hypothetical protein JNK25_14580, partial [Phycisphaerae bacterium]|nr:hypothetical protein [Phycisphaerae bacterium]
MNQRHPPRARRLGPRPLAALVTLGVLVLAGPARAWDAHGHRLITLLALDRLALDLPEFLRDPQVRAMIAENSNEPDRWRSVRQGHLMHLNGPDHYLDVEDLGHYGLTLRDIPPLRYEFVSLMAITREKLGSEFKGRPINAARDIAKTAQWPGFVAHAIAENYGKLTASFKTLRILETLDDPDRDHQISAQRGNIAAIIGVLSHFVGDTAQPLHTTRHHHGWVGDNPGNYTTRYSFHAYIDGTILDIHKLDYEAMREDPPHDAARLPRTRDVDPMNPWRAILDHVQRSHEQVVPLYELEKSGELVGDPGRELI